jgi:ABC-2 type transport system permease protein
MLVRVASPEPPPVWQVALSIGIGVAAVFGAIWFAGRVFRIGLLMHGKPPNLATLIRWARSG